MPETPRRVAAHAQPARSRRLLIAALATAIVLVAAIVAVVAVRLSAGASPEASGPDSLAGVPTRSVSSMPSPTPTPTPTPTLEEPAPPPEEPAPPPPPEPVCADDVLVCVNIARVANGLGEVSADGTLDAAAQECANRMAASGQLTHSAGGPGGYSTWGENIAVGYPSAAAVFEGWMNSPGHRANILNPGYTSMGIAVASGNWWCQQFGG